MRLVQVDRLAGQLVGEVDGPLDQSSAVFAAGGCARVSASRNSRTGRSERNVVCCVIRAIGLLAGL